MYYEYQELVKTIVPHRILAVNRAEKEGVLKVSLEVDETIPLEKMMKKVGIKEQLMLSIKI